MYTRINETFVAKTGNCRRKSDGAFNSAKIVRKGVVSSEKTCKGYCTQMSNCEAANYNSSSKNCVLYTKDTSEFDGDGVAGKVCYLKPATSTL
jgi:CRISPR/Cas system Type II protein with McrA/HNH and RuvC-like nuclease domain